MKSAPADLPRPIRCAPAMRGFSLIEMMIAITTGMIVIAGATALIVAIDQSNSQTLQTMRAHQELRALAQTIADEIRRSRRLHDAMARVGGGADAHGAFDFVDASAGNCILYGYQGPTQYDPAADAAPASNHFRAIGLQTRSGTGTVVLASSGGPTSAPGCGGAGTALSSPRIDITAMRVTCASPELSAAQAKASCNEIVLILQGRPKPALGFSTPPTYTYRQPIFIRSGAVKTG